MEGGNIDIFFDALPKDLQTNSLVANRAEAASRNASNPSAGMGPSVLDPSGVMVWIKVVGIKEKKTRRKVNFKQRCKAIKLLACNCIFLVLGGSVCGQHLEVYPRQQSELEELACSSSYGLMVCVWWGKKVCKSRRGRLSNTWEETKSCIILCNADSKMSKHVLKMHDKDVRSRV